MPKIIKMPRITREFAKQHPDWVFVFGDNFHKHGLGGLAKELRGEPNAIGIPTKWAPYMREDAFFSDKMTEYDFQSVRCEILLSIKKIAEHLRAGRVVVFPTNGVGTGLSEMPKRAPKLFAWMTGLIENLERTETDVER